MNEPLIGRGPNIDTSMIVLLISKYAEPLALSIIECLRKNDGIVEVEVLVVVVMIDFVVVLECWGLSFLKVPIIVFYHSLYVCLLNWFIIDSKTRIADSTMYVCYKCI